MRKLMLGLMASMVMAAGGPAAHAAITCSYIPSMCPAPGGNGSNQGGKSVPEPGTVGLLVLGAAASLRMIRRKKP